MAIVARTFCILMLYLGFLMAGAGYQMWARVDRVEARKRGATRRG